jgi:hypothetical protein
LTRTPKAPSTRNLMKSAELRNRNQCVEDEFVDVAQAKL